jgi:transcriptional regulator with XRE-family HTH domain
VNAVDSGDFKRWRKQLRLNQFEAGQMLSVSRGAVQHWESGHGPIPYAVELACSELTRRWKQRPEFGPVILAHADGPMWHRPEELRRMLILQCEPCANNRFAIEQACRLSKAPDFINPFIMEENFDIVWTCSELQRECEQRTSESGTTTEPPDGGRG